MPPSSTAPTGSGRPSQPGLPAAPSVRATPAPRQAPTWLRDEAVIAGRIIVIGVAALFLVWVALQVTIITVAAFIAFAQAALLWPLVQKLSSAMPRPLAALLVVGLYIAAILTLIWFILVQMINAWPVLFSAVLGSIDAANSWFLERGWAMSPDVIDNLQEQAQSRLGQLFSGISGAALSTLGALGSGATVLLVATFATLFALVGGEKMVQGLVSSTPRSRRDNAYTALKDAVTAARWWMLASSVTGMVDGVFIGIGLHLLGVPLAIPIGLATFILGFIPMIGATVAGAIAVAVALFFGGLNLAIATVVLVLAVQQIEGNVLSPLLLSKAMQFPPLLTLLLSTTGGAAFGLVGLFLAVPLAGILTAAVRGWKAPRRGNGDPTALSGPDSGGGAPADEREPSDEAEPPDDTETPSADEPPTEAAGHDGTSANAATSRTAASRTD